MQQDLGAQSDIGDNTPPPPPRRSARLQNIRDRQNQARQNQAQNQQNQVQNTDVDNEEKEETESNTSQQQNQGQDDISVPRLPDRLNAQDQNDIRRQMDRLQQLIQASNQHIQIVIQENKKLQQQNTTLHQEVTHINNRKVIPGLTPKETEEILKDKERLDDKIYNALDDADFDHDGNRHEVDRIWKILNNIKDKLTESTDFVEYFSKFDHETIAHRIPKRDRLTKLTTALMSSELKTKYLNATLTTDLSDYDKLKEWLYTRHNGKEKIITRENKIFSWKRTDKSLVDAFENFMKLVNVYVREVQFAFTYGVKTWEVDVLQEGRIFIYFLNQCKPENTEIYKIYNYIGGYKTLSKLRKIVKIVEKQIRPGLGINFSGRTTNTNKEREQMTLIEEDQDHSDSSNDSDHHIAYTQRSKSFNRSKRRFSNRKNRNYQNIKFQKLGRCNHCKGKHPTQNCWEIYPWKKKSYLKALEKRKSYKNKNKRSRKNTIYAIEQILRESDWFNNKSTEQSDDNNDRSDDISNNETINTDTINQDNVEWYTLNENNEEVPYVDEHEEITPEETTTASQETINTIEDTRECKFSYANPRQ